ncbi:MAG: DUF488 domain-containing protein [Thermoplasmataceae archaeon]
MITIARVYDNRSHAGAISVLVDRVWPRGITKEKAGVDLWMKEIAPSDELRKWFNHEDSKWTEFRSRYFAELDGKREIVRALRGISKGGDIILLFSARNIDHNNAVALKEYLEGHTDTGLVDPEH